LGWDRECALSALGTLSRADDNESRLHVGRTSGRSGRSNRATSQENDRKDLKPWRFHAFCVPGKGWAGTQLTSVFDPLPEPASYFESNFDMLLDTSRDIHVDYDHVITM
jgi:hypothetical protein